MRFVVEGTPVPQGSKKAFVVKGPKGPRAVMIDDEKAALKVWRDLVTAAARAAMLDPVSPIQTIPAQVAVKVEIEFRMARPKTVKPEVRPFPSVSPDVDKLARAVLDAMTTAGVYVDDGQVIDLHPTQVYAEPGEAPGAVVGVWEYEKGNG